MPAPSYYIGNIAVREGTTMILNSAGAEGDIFILKDEPNSRVDFFVKVDGSYVAFSAKDIFDIGVLTPQDGKVIKARNSKWSVGDSIENLDSMSQIQDFNSDLSEYMIFVADESRNNKVLSLESTTFRFAESMIHDDDWLRIGDASDSDVGFIMPFDGTVIRCTGFCEDVRGTTTDLDLYVNNSNKGSILTFTGNDSQKVINSTIDMDFNRGDKLRVRSNIAGWGSHIRDTSIVVWVKWRKT